MTLRKVSLYMFLQMILFCLMMACSKSSTSFTNNQDSTMNTSDTTTFDSSKHTWLALGDSYTIGESVYANERFPAQTITLLKNNGLLFNEPDYIATTGWTTTNLLDAIETKNPKGRYDVVSLLIGVNDQYQRGDTNGYRERFTECLQKAISVAKDANRAFVISIPDYSVTPFAQNSDTELIKKQIDEFNDINKEVTLSLNISYTYITDLTRLAKDDATLIAKDGLHPSAKEYGKWAILLAPKIEKALQ